MTLHPFTFEPGRLQLHVHPPQGGDIRGCSYAAVDVTGLWANADGTTTIRLRTGGDFSVTVRAAETLVEVVEQLQRHNPRLKFSVVLP